MDAFVYKDGELYCEQVPVRRIADDVGTPAYVYSTAAVLGRFRALRQAFASLDPLICFSIKSCWNTHICRLLRAEGAGFDIVSGGELFRALQAGGDAAQIVYAGVGKTDKEVVEAMQAGVGWFNVESEPEIENLQRLATARNIVVRAALRINPDVDPKTHTYTTTGKKETKFGVDIERARRAFHDYGRQPNVRLCGLHLHIGSPVNSVQPYVEAVTKTLALADELRSDGFTIDTLNLGGGFGADYEEDEAPALEEYANAIVPLLAERSLKVIIEPGRTIVANAAVLVTEVVFVKQSGRRNFVIVDAAMNDLIRPSLYGAYHFVWPVRPGREWMPEARKADLVMPDTEEVDVVGPLCETGDFLAKGRHLPPASRGDRLAIFSAGAYAIVMSSQYNSRPRSPEVLVDGESYRLIRRRETYDDLVAAERV